MLSSHSLKIAVLGLTVAIAGCNRESGEKAQPQASASATAVPAGGGEALQGAIDRSHKGSDMPDFTLTDQAGKQVKLASFKGKPLLVNLWATWCAPCVVELPMLEKLAATRSAELKVLTVSQDMPSTADKVAEFLASKGATHLEPWLDPQNDLAVAYEVTTLPTTVFYGSDGKEVWRYVGGHDWTSAEAAEMLAEAR